MGRGTTERAGTGGRCKRGARKQSPVPLCCASRPGWGAAAGTAPGAVLLPENSLRPPRLGAAERVVNAGGGGARAEVEEGAGARHGVFSPLLQQETRRRRRSPSASVM